MIDEDARERILSWIERGARRGRRGARRRRPRRRPDQADGDRERAPDLKVCREEVFGPVCVVNPYESLDEAIALANGTRYGLQAGSSPRTFAPRCGRPASLEFGGVTVNEAPTFRSDQMPYGGVKDSGNTREGPAYSVRELTEQRVVVIDL